MTETISAWILVIALSCPNQPGFCAVQYSRAESRAECEAVMAVSRVRYAQQSRFIYAKCYQDQAWPENVWAIGDLLEPPPMPKRKRR